MVNIRSQFLRRCTGAVAIVAALVGLSAALSPAHARVWVGFGFPLYLGPPPLYYPPPVYYPPPAYYPPPVTYAPAPQAPYTPAPGPTAGQSCYAGAYVCPMEHPVASGSGCYCTGNNGSRVWGQAN